MTAPLRVLFVDHEHRLSGGERDLIDLLRGFPDGAVEAHLAVPSDGPLADAATALGASVHRFSLDDRLRSTSRWELSRRPLRVGREALSASGAARSLAAIVAEVRPDVVHTNSMKAHVLAVPAAVIRRRPLIWHVRDILEAGWLRRAFGTLGGLAPAAVICISNAVADSLATTPARRRLRVVHNGVRPVPPEPATVAAWREQLGAGHDDVVVGIVGQIARWKGQDVFLDAAARVAAELPTARFAIVGECLFPENEGDYETALHEQVARLGLGDRVTWTGSVDPVEPVMAAFDVAIHASRLPEPFGRVIVEAMALGVPVVSTTIGAGPELIPPGAGALVPPGDPIALADAILSIAPTRADAASHRAAAVAAAATFDISATGAAVLDVYRSLGLR